MGRLGIEGDRGVGEIKEGGLSMVSRGGEVKWGGNVGGGWGKGK